MAAKRILEVEITGKADGVAQMSGQVENTFSAMSSAVAGGFFAAGQAVFGVLQDIGTKVATFALDSAHTYEDMGMNAIKISRLTGMGMEQSSQLAFLASQTGVSVESLAKGLKVFDKNIASGAVGDYRDALKDQGKAATETASANEALSKATQRLSDLEAIQHAKKHLTVSDQIALRNAHQAVTDAQTKLTDATTKGTNAFDQVGIKTRDAAGNILPMRDILASVADKFEGMPDGIEKTALAGSLFGQKMGPDLIPMLNQGSDAIGDIMDEADKMGLAFSDADKENIKAAKHAEREASAAWKGLQVTLGREVLPILTKVEKWFSDRMPAAIATLKQWFAEHRKDIDEWKDKLTNAFQWVQDNIPKIIATVVDNWNAFQAGLDKIRPAIDAVVWVIKEMWSNFQISIDVIGWLIDKGSWLVDWFTNSAWPAISGFGGVIHDVFFGIKDWISDAWNWVFDKTEGLISFFQNLPGRISDAVSGMWDGLKDAFRNALNWLIWKWNSFTITTPDVPGTDWGGQHITMPQVPYLHSGGVFRAPAGKDEGLAMLRDGERVLTPQQQHQSSAPIHVHVHTLNATRETGKMIAESIEEYRRGGGRIAV